MKKALIILLLFAAIPCFAQMPMGEEEAKPKKAAATTEVAASAQAVDAAKAESGKVDGMKGLHDKFLAEGSPYRPVILSILTLIIVLQIKRFATKRIKRTLAEKAFTKENADAFMKTWNGIWGFTTAILVIIAMSGSIRLLGLTAGFFGMMLGWSLQQPVTGIAAWLMIIMKRPFRIGDRIVVAGMTGDVTGITLTHVILNQVGGSVGGEERSGRGILIPNAILFNHVIINYTLDQEYMLDEVPVRLTFDSDWDRAKELLVAAATEVTGDIIAKTGMEPFIRAEFLDWGVLVRLRYNTIPVNRQEISTKIIEKLLAAFKTEYPRVRFAIPSTNVRHQPAWPEKTEEVAAEA